MEQDLGQYLIAKNIIVFELVAAIAISINCKNLKHNCLLSSVQSLSHVRLFATP